MWPAHLSGSLWAPAPPLAGENSPDCLSFCEPDMEPQVPHLIVGVKSGRNAASPGSAPLRYPLRDVTASFYKILFILPVLGLRCCKDLSLAVASRGCPLVEVLGLLIALTYLVAKHGLQGTRTSVVAGWGSGVVAPGP